MAYSQWALNKKCFIAFFNSHKKFSAAALHLYFPFEQTSFTKFEKNIRFNDLSSNDICCYKKISFQISKGEESPPLQNTKQPKSFSFRRKEQVKGVVLTVWKRMKGHTWEELRNKSHSFSYLLNSCYYMPSTFPRTWNRVLNKTGEMTVFTELTHYLEEWWEVGD